MSETIKAVLWDIITRIKDVNNRFTKVEIDKNLDEVKLRTGSIGKTLSNTCSRELQVLRDLRCIKFLTPGNYEVCGEYIPKGTRRAVIHRKNVSVITKGGNAGEVSKLNAGYLYAISCPHWKDNHYKCGLTRVDAEIREYLGGKRYGTVMGPDAEIHALYKVNDCIEGEKLLFALIDKYRVYRIPYEIFCIEFDKLIEAMDEVIGETGVGGELITVRQISKL